MTLVRIDISVYIYPLKYSHAFMNHPVHLHTTYRDEIPWNILMITNTRSITYTHTSKYQLSTLFRSLL